MGLCLSFVIQPMVDDTTFGALEEYAPYSYFERCLTGLKVKNMAYHKQIGYTPAFYMTSRCHAVTGNHCNVYKWSFKEKLKKCRGPRFANTEQLIQHV